MSGMINKSFVIILSLSAVGASSAAVAQGVNIPQVPKDAAPVENAGEPSVSGKDVPNNEDYQNEVLSNPEINDRARAEAAINGSGGNTAVINQSGDSNISSVI